MERKFTAEQVMFRDKKVFATACEYGIKMSAEELAEQITCGERLGYFKIEDILKDVLKTMAKVEEKLSGMSDLEIGGYYAEKLNEALAEMTEEVRK